MMIFLIRGFLLRLSLSTLLLFFSVIFNASYACTPDACIITGHHQDALILGEVVSLSKGNTGVKIRFVFPHTKLVAIRKEDVILVKDDSFLANNAKKRFSMKSQYLFSLNKTKSAYEVKWGAYEVKGNHYSDMRLIDKSIWASQELEHFIHSGGNKAVP